MSIGIPKITPEFKDFISSLLKRANLSEKSTTSYTDESSMLEFRQAFTHKSYHPTFNYEFLEFRGDVVGNLAAVQYIRCRFPQITSTTWLTKLKHNFDSGRDLSKLAYEGGFLCHILYGREMEHIVSSQNMENHDFVSLLEDSFEAFCGALVSVIEKKSLRGVGYAVAYSIIKSFRDKENISLKYEVVFDAKTRVKQIYDSLGWAFEQSIYTIPIKGSLYKTTLKGYPSGDRSRTKENMTVISYRTGSTKDIAEESTCQYALQTLKRKYNIEEKIPSMYSSYESEIPPPPSIPDGFKDFIISLLRRSRVNEKTIFILTDEEYLLDFRMSFVHDSYDPYENHNIYKFEGITALELVVAEYLVFKFPKIKSEKWLTHLKQNIVSKGMFTDIAVEGDFQRFILYGENIGDSLIKYPDKSRNTEYKSMLSDVFKAFVGALMIVSNKVRQRGVGYAVVYNFVSFYMDQIEISIKYTDVFNYKTRLKELFDSYKWKFDQSITINYDEKENQQVATVVGYPKGNKSRQPGNAVVLATRSGRTKKEAAQKASSDALNKLDRMYKIRDIPPDPYN